MCEVEFLKRKNRRWVFNFANSGGVLDMGMNIKEGVNKAA